MQHLLLLGAGFSRNWGGWLAEEVFEYLLGDPGIQKDSFLKNYLWNPKFKANYETALGELQVECATSKNSSKLESLEVLQKGISNMFLEMDKGFLQHRGMNFINAPNGRFVNNSIDVFLARFDAIFSLNQDLLLERFYFDNIELVSNNARKKWVGIEIPGMQKVSTNPSLEENPWITTWKEKEDLDLAFSENFQPYFKLHGSFNWKSSNSDSMMIVGGNKAGAINSFPVLKSYCEEFERRLCEPKTRLVIIGYSFRDDHINSFLFEGAKSKNLEIFLIDPLGFRALSQNNETREGQITTRSDEEKILEPILIGASRRSLPEIFGSDKVEFEKVMKVFN